jgi:transcriptional regulator with XRE-family HTH domain
VRKKVAMWAAFLAELLRQYGGTQQDFARAIGKTPATVSHWRNRASAPKPGIEVCLRIAVETRTSASEVLRAAGKSAIADLIEQLYGGPARMRTTDPSVSRADKRLLQQIAALDPRTRRALLYLIKRNTKEPPAK